MLQTVDRIYHLSRDCGFASNFECHFFGEASPLPPRLPQGSDLKIRTNKIAPGCWPSEPMAGVPAMPSTSLGGGGIATPVLLR